MKKLSLKDIQKVSLEILIEVDRICRTHNITYYLFYGTLIGAVRHKGFIPWDDDIDIIMPREDFERFKNVFPAKSSPDYYYSLIDYETEKNCPYMITRISDNRYHLDTVYGSNYEIGVFIDIYPFDGLGNTKVIARQICRKSIHNLRGLSKSTEKNIYRSVMDLHKGIKKLLLFFTYIIPKLKGPQYYRKRSVALAKKFDYKDSKYIGCVIGGCDYNDYYEKKLLCEGIDIEFEGNYFRAPKEYDTLLRQYYGNYMKLPPCSERVGHHFYTIYKIQE